MIVRCSANRRASATETSSRTTLSSTTQRWAPHFCSAPTGSLCCSNSRGAGPTFPTSARRLLFRRIAAPLRRACARGRRWMSTRPRTSHCFLRPSNRRGQILHGKSAPPLVQLCDFGVARRMEQGKMTARTFMGSPGFLAPQARRPPTNLRGGYAQQPELSCCSSLREPTGALSYLRTPDPLTGCRALVPASQVMRAGISGSRDAGGARGSNSTDEEDEQDLSPVHCAPPSPSLPSDPVRPIHRTESPAQTSGEGWVVARAGVVAAAPAADAPSAQLRCNSR